MGPMLGRLKGKHTTILWTSNALSKNSAYTGYVGGDSRWRAGYLMVSEEPKQGRNTVEDLKECSRYLI